MTGGFLESFVVLMVAGVVKYFDVPAPNESKLHAIAEECYRRDEKPRYELKPNNVVHITCVKE